MANPVNLYVIEEPQLRMLLQDPRITAILPCLSAPKTKLDSLVRGNPACPKCDRKIRSERANAIRAAMQCIQGARGGTLANLKVALNANQLRLTIAGTGGKLIRITL